MNLLIDLDGTLMDPREGFIACIRHALASVDCVTPTDDEIASHIGPPLEETLAVLLGPDLRHQVNQAAVLYRQRYAGVGIYENAVYAGIPEALRELQSTGAKLILATSKPQVFALRILEHFRLRQFFASVYGSELDGSRANKAELIAHLVRHESIEPHSTYMIGDRMHDVRGAKANSIATIGVLWGYGSIDELNTAGAIALCERPEELCSATLACAG